MGIEMKLKPLEKIIKLTPLEKIMHQQLCEKGEILWRYTKSVETQALNRLIRKGLATYDGKKKAWNPS